MIVGELVAMLDARFPFANAGDWDPVGLQVGGAERPAKRIAVCHEVTAKVVTAVLDEGIECLVSYHPLLFEPSTSLVESASAERQALRLAENKTSLIVVHTAFDVATPGTADAFLGELGISAETVFAPVDESGGGHIGRVGRFESAISFEDLAIKVEAVVGSRVRKSASHPDVVEAIAIVPGSGSGFASAAADLADVYVSGDLRHHDVSEAASRGLGVIDAGHIPTERPGVRALYDAVCDVAPTAIMADSDPHPWEA